MQSQHSRIAIRLLSIALVLGGITASASAHHGWGGYAAKELELTGTVSTPLAVVSPHATMKVTVDGQVWSLTLAPPAATNKSGIKDANIPVGATVTIHGHRSSNPKNFEIKTERITYNGKTFNLYPDRT